MRAPGLGRKMGEVEVGEHLSHGWTTRCLRPATAFIATTLGQIWMKFTNGQQIYLGRGWQSLWIYPTQDSKEPRFSGQKWPSRVPNGERLWVCGFGREMGKYPEHNRILFFPSGSSKGYFFHEYTENWWIDHSQFWKMRTLSSSQRLLGFELYRVDRPFYINYWYFLIEHDQKPIVNGC